MRPSLPLLAVASLVLSAAPGCGDDDAGAADAGAADAGGDAAVVSSACAASPAPETPAASCHVEIELPPVPSDASRHVPEGTVVSYCSNPPSSGPHYPVWADFRVYTTEIASSYLVHDLEHGAVELLYKCDDGCPDIVAGLTAIRDAQPQDPLCTPYGEKSRVIVAPSRTIPTKVAAVAWGAVYRADCLDTATLSAFVTAHYGQGPEKICAPGRAF